MTDAALRAYLLGRLTASEAAVVEASLLEDADLFSRMETAEDDLFDAVARNNLDADDRARFMERFGDEYGRRQFAQALVHRTASVRVLPFVQRRSGQLAIAASLTIAVGVYVIQRPALPDLPADAPAVQSPAPIAPPPITSNVSLALATSRAADAAEVVTIDSSTTLIDFRIRLNPADRFALYAVGLRGRADDIIWSNNAVQPATDGGELLVHALVPAERAPDGIYEIGVRGGADARSLDDLGFITIEIRRAR
jgi:hypothetical protein